jgi:hypothetical protein
MIWTTEKIIQLKTLVNRGDSIKSIVRDIMIDSVLDTESNTEIVFPFFTHKDKVNTNFKNSNILYEFTDDEVKKLLYYRYNPNEFLEEVISTSFLRSWMKIPQNFRKYFLEKSNESKFLYAKVPLRKLGTTCFLSFLAYYHLVFDKTQITYDILILSSDDKYKIVSYIRDMYELTPFFIKPGLKEMKPNQIDFDNGCITVVNDLNNLDRSYDMVIVDDFFDRSIFSSIFPIISARRDSRMIVASTNYSEDQRGDVDSIFDVVDMKDFIRENNLNEFIEN